jgi:hypothetical protein
MVTHGGKWAWASRSRMDGMTVSQQLKELDRARTARGLEVIFTSYSIVHTQLQFLLIDSVSGFTVLRSDAIFLLGGDAISLLQIPEPSHESGTGELGIGAGQAVRWGRRAGPYRFG